MALCTACAPGQLSDSLISGVAGGTGDLGRRRGIAAAATTHNAVNHDHAHSRDVAALNAVKEVTPGRMLGLVHKHEVSGTTDFDQPAIEIAYARGIAGGKAKRQLGRNVPQARQ